MVLPRHIVNGRFRDTLSQADIRFVVTSLTHDGAAADGLMRLLTDAATRDAILDSPQLFSSLRSIQGPIPVSAQLYFYILLRHSLRHQGIDNAHVAAYIAAVLAQPAASLTQSPDSPASDRKPFEYTSDLLEALSHSQGYDWFCLATAIADQSLLLTGVFSDLLYARQSRRGAPGLNYYETIGRSHYHIASQHRLADEFELKETLQTLAQGFPQVRTALAHIKKDYLRFSYN